ncbi:MAG TPA: sugar ABC transporter substrate-binding protein [Thermotogota bacterium]|mgnify:CR=1 FL=1|nr:sugar ABC transporter substrate-binding protein [Thermotogota bacterium]HRW93068.1 sugar ABC transporter substrate-binding protein [Thermotogota bacterium]
MKKWIVASLVLVFLLTLTFAEPVKLVLTHWGNDLDNKVYNERAKLLHEKYPDITLEIMHIPGDYSQKVQTMIAGGMAPDILQLAEDMHAYSSKGQLLGLNAMVSEHGLDLSRFSAGLLGQYSYKGELYGLPDRSGAMIVYYNKDFFDEAGLAYPDKSWKWADLLSAAQKLTVREGELVTRYGFAAGDWWPWWMSFMAQNGGKILDENGEPVVNTPENIEAIQFYNDLVYKYGVAPSRVDFANMGNIGPDQLFAQGKTAMEITGMWNIGSLQNVPELNWDIAPLWGEKVNATVAFGSGLSISSACKNKEAAFLAIEFLTSFDGQLPIVDNLQDAPANLELLNSPLFLDAPWSANPINMNAFGDSADMIMDIPTVPEWNEILKAFGDYLSEVFMENMSVEEGLENIQEELEFVLF